ncbi:MAG TPA: restriction endonuclease subunit R [Bacteroidales bacterium]|nr:restriction endonuclease subunit R [Bacteroidales bacterium]
MNKANGYPLNFPTYQFRLRQEDGNRYIFDIIRKKFITLTPEEWVRQHLVNYLVNNLQVPVALIGIEVSFSFNNVNQRADVVVYNRKGIPLMVAECKAPTVEITDVAIDQVCAYNYVLNAEYLVITNGLKHYVLQFSASNEWVALNNFPELTKKI